MKAKLFIIGLIAIALAACSKDQFSTKPQLTFKSVNDTSFVQRQLMTFKIDFTDKEGDIQDTLWVQKISFTCSDGDFTSGYQVPDFTATKNLQGQFEINYVYNASDGGYPSINACPTAARVDSCYFRFWLKDKGNHISDTVRSPVIKLLAQ
ncbi:hypothetical protein [Deminuibacter soli]|uniref:hypothetical protein n=1 Tax=Deminuibacter soli TaxID=2291815 RepID=UPI001314ABFE|nr:hypothetical protein [Deminuibacter soli]